MVGFGAALVFGIVAVVFAWIAFAGGRTEEMQTYVSSHKLYFRTIAIILILSELVILLDLIAGPRR